MSKLDSERVRVEIVFLFISECGGVRCFWASVPHIFSIFSVSHSILLSIVIIYLDRKTLFAIREGSTESKAKNRSNLTRNRDDDNENRERKREEETRNICFDGYCMDVYIVNFPFYLCLLDCFGRNRKLFVFVFLFLFSWIHLALCFIFIRAGFLSFSDVLSYYVILRSVRLDVYINSFVKAVIVCHMVVLDASPYLENIARFDGHE